MRYKTLTPASNSLVWSGKVYLKRVQTLETKLVPSKENFFIMRKLIRGFWLAFWLILITLKLRLVNMPKLLCLTDYCKTQTAAGVKYKKNKTDTLYNYNTTTLTQ